jgi:hypothetical protein
MIFGNVITNGTKWMFYMQGWNKCKYLLIIILSFCPHSMQSMAYQLVHVKNLYHHWPCEIRILTMLFQVFFLLCCDWSLLAHGNINKGAHSLINLVGLLHILWLHIIIDVPQLYPFTIRKYVVVHSRFHYICEWIWTFLPGEII